MKKALSILGLLFLVVAFQACKSDDELQTSVVNNNYYTTANGITVLKEEAQLFIVESPTNDSLLVFSSSTPDEALPNVGTIIYVPITEKTPYGFLGKVTAIEKGNEIMVKTESVPLEEAFDNLSVDTVINLMDKVESVLDEDGNPIQYEMIDSTLTESGDAKTRAGGYWQGGVIKFPFTIGKREDGHELIGALYAELTNFDFNVDIVNNELRYIDVKADPTVKISLTDRIKIKKREEKSKLIGTVNCAPITIPTPIIVPIILRPKLYLYLVYGATGEITASLSLQYQKSFETEIHWRNGTWDKKLLCNDLKNENPWTVTEFDVNGELYIGSKMGLLVGLYSATTGIGITVTPKISLGAEAKLSTENLLDINPQVELAAKWSGDLYFTASLFNRPIAHYSFSSPEYVAWSEKLYLFPQFGDFEAIGASTSGEVSYNTDSHYFLAALGVKTGARVYESDKKTIVGTYFTDKTSTDNKGINYFNVNVDGLNPGATYYAAPVCSWLGYTWPSSSKKEFTTEASYHLGFRCASQSYDVISFNFSLNNTTGNVIDYTTEATDYSGEPMRVHITAQYNASTQTLDGIFDFYFYNDPGQQRKDGFSVSLATDDSGYVDCSKVVDNGGCYAALRIHKQSSRAATAKRYNKPLYEDDCNIGIFNKYYKK